MLKVVSTTAHGILQFSDYFDIYEIKRGYLLIYDFNKGKIYKLEKLKNTCGKQKMYFNTRT